MTSRSRGHVAFLFNGTTELYLDAAGDLWRAPVGNAFQNGMRIGRWEAPPHVAVTGLALLLSADAGTDNAAWHMAEAERLLAEAGR